MFSKFRSIFFGLVSVLFLATPVLAYVSPGARDGYVNDFASMLAADTENALEDQLAQFQSTSGAEIVVATIPSLRGDTVENYAGKLFAEWHLERPNYTKGALLLVARDDHAIRIQTGSGLKDVITDSVASDIIQETIIPAFQEDNFGAGIQAAVQGIIDRVALPAPAVNTDGGSSWKAIIPFILFVLIVVIAVIITRKNKGRRSGGGMSMGGPTPPASGGASGKW